MPGVTGETDTAVDRAVGDSGSQLSLLFCQNHQYGRTVATLPTRQISTYNPPTKPNRFYLIHPSLHRIQSIKKRKLLKYSFIMQRGFAQVQIYRFIMKEKRMWHGRAIPFLIVPNELPQVPCTTWHVQIYQWCTTQQFEWNSSKRVWLDLLVLERGSGNKMVTKKRWWERVMQQKIQVIFFLSAFCIRNRYKTHSKGHTKI